MNCPRCGERIALDLHPSERVVIVMEGSVSSPRQEASTWHIACRSAELRETETPPTASELCGTNRLADWFGMTDIPDDLPTLRADHRKLLKRVEDVEYRLDQHECPHAPISYAGRATARAATPRSQPEPAWRVGTHYGIHVYAGDLPVATFLTAADAKRAVEAVNGRRVHPPRFADHAKTLRKEADYLESEEFPEVADRLRRIAAVLAGDNDA